MLCSFCKRKADEFTVGLCPDCWSETAPDMQAVILKGETLYECHPTRFWNFFPEGIVGKEDGIGAMEAADLPSTIAARFEEFAEPMPSESRAVDAYEQTIKLFDSLNVSLGADAEDYFDLMLGHLEVTVKNYAKQRKRRLRDHLKMTK